MIAQPTIEQVRDLPIEGVVQPFTTLKHAGRGKWVGLCPFHDEKTPSFHVNAEGNYFKCFGCGKGGDGITFIREKENLSFTGAVEWLARQFNIPITHENDANHDEREKLFELAEKEARQATAAFAGSPAEQYVTSRGLNADTVSVFGLGFYAGLLAVPIRNASGRVISRATRPLAAATGAKWVNGPNNLIYQKSRVLFGLDVARRSIMQRDVTIIVEGYFDCMALHQAGYTHTVALCGTACTPEQTELLRRYTQNVWLCLDADGAGRKAAEALALQLLAAGFHVEIVHPAIPCDIDEVLQRHPGYVKAILK